VKLRLEEYTREGIDCAKIQFPDNVKQLTLLDHKSKGVFALLDDQCRAPGGSDQGFVDNCNQTFFPEKTGSVCYDKVKRGKGGLVGEKHGNTYPSHGGELDRMSFVVVHFAEPVCYTAEGWLDKNRGYLHPDVAYVLTQSDSALIREIFPMSVLDVAKKSTVGALFRKSLRSLSATMLTTSQNYVRCIKPNGKKVPDNFDGHFSLRQLRYTGVASVVQIQRSGYPISMSHKEFIGRYRCITLGDPKLPKLLASSPPKEGATALVKAGPRIAGLKDVDWLASSDCQVGVTRIYLRDEIVKALEAPRMDATRKAAISLQRRQRVKIAKAVWSVLSMHKNGSAKVRAALDAHDTELSGDLLEALTKSWAAVTLPLGLADGMVGAAKDELPQLANEIAALEEGLEAEATALADLQAALAAVASEGPKAGYVKLKVALQAANKASRGLRADLTKSMAMAEEAMVGCLTGSGMSADAAAAMLAKMKAAKDAYDADHQTEGQRKADDEVFAAAEAAAMAAAEAQAEAKRLAAEADAEEARVAKELADMEAEVKRQELEKERLHREMLHNTAQELVKAAAAAEPSVIITIVTLANDVDMSSSTEQKQLKGYTEQSTGVTFSEKNTVSKLRKGGLAALQGMLQVGDTILAVQGTPLKGEHVVVALNAEKLATYELTIARSSAIAAATQVGEFQGWVYMVKSKDGTALPLQWPKKQWAVLDKKSNLSFFEKKRDEKPLRVVSLKGADAKTPVTKLRGAELKQPPVISNFIAQLRFPFTLLWPNHEVDHDICLATTTGEERANWMKALNKTIKMLKAQAPTSGWLVKKGGRTKKGLLQWLSRDKRRWFVLIQPEEGQDAIFRYFDGPPSSFTAPARGAVVLNRSAKLEVDIDAGMPHAFRVTSKGANDARELTTVLAAETNAEMGRWMKALHTAISTSGGKVTDLEDLQVARKAAAQKLQKNADKPNNLRQLARLEVEQLKELPIKKLHEIAEYLDAPFDRKKDKDPKKLAEIIMGQRNAQAADALNQSNLELSQLSTKKPVAAVKGAAPKKFYGKNEGVWGLWSHFF